MKNLFFYFRTLMVLAVLFISCDRNEDNPVPTPNTSGLVPKKIVEKDASGKVVNEITFTYDGNKMLQADNTAKIDGVASVKFTYTGDRITKYEYVRPGSSNDQVTIDYNASGKPSKISGSKYTNVGKFFGDYTYNADGSVSINNGAYTTTISYSGSNPVKMVTTGGSATETIEYKYNANNNSVFKEVTGMDVIRDFGYVSSFYALPGQNFVTEQIGSNGTWGNKSDTYTATFNADKLPVKVTSKSGFTYEITY